MTISDTARTVTAVIEEIEGITSATREVLQRAEHQARMMEASTIYPEHLFLSALQTSSENIATTLSNLGLDQQLLVAQVAMMLEERETIEEQMQQITLSKEAEDCLSWALVFAASLHISDLHPEHIVLGTIRHQRVQPLLDLLLSQIEFAPPSYVSEETPVGYSRAIDQLIRSRIRVQQDILSPIQTTRRLLTSLERPAVTFADILGFSRAKQELWPFIEILRKPRRAQSGRQASLYGVVLVGPPSNNRALLMRAMAGEAIVPLICLSLSALVMMANAISRHEIGDLDVDLTSEQYRAICEQRAIQKGREIISTVFQQARQASPCILMLEDIDEMMHLDEHVRTHWSKQLLVEIDARDYHPAFVLVAATHRLDLLDPALLLQGRLEHRVILDGASTRPFMRGVGLCPTCQHEISMHWKYCVYCGEALAKTCVRCGECLPDVPGVHFCPECGAVNNQ